MINALYILVILLLIAVAGLSGFAIGFAVSNSRHFTYVLDKVIQSKEATKKVEDQCNELEQFVQSIIVDEDDLDCEHSDVN